jgi:glycine/D-amino acid oxidase-like deaminating enzyme
MSSPSTSPNWGIPPWEISFKPQERKLPPFVDFAIVGGGFTGLAAAAWLRLLAPDKSVIVLEAGTIGCGASGRTGGMILAETAAGDQPGLGDVLAGVESIFAKLSDAVGFSIAERGELSLTGAWEIGRKGGRKDSPIQWSDSGTLRVVGEVPGGTIDPGGVVSALGDAAEKLGATIFENCKVESIVLPTPTQIEIRDGRVTHANKILFATNAISLELAGYGDDANPRLTLAAATAPISEDEVRAIGLGERKPFYTVDFPYLWARLRSDNSIIWGAGLVEPPRSKDLTQVDIADTKPTDMFMTLEKRIRGLHRSLAEIKFTHLWGGPILFRENWTPVFDRHPENPNALLLGAYAGHGIALSSYLGSWAAEVMLGRRELPSWAALRR